MSGEPLHTVSHTIFGDGFGECEPSGEYHPLNGQTKLRHDTLLRIILLGRTKTCADSTYLHETTSATRINVCANRPLNAASSRACCSHAAPLFPQLSPDPAQSLGVYRGLTTSWGKCSEVRRPGYLCKRRRDALLKVILSLIFLDFVGRDLLSISIDSLKTFLTI